jgi:uncharacterized protein with PIN domain
MAKGTFRFYEELNDFLPQHLKKVDIEAEFIGKKSIKETIKDLDVLPSTVDLVLVNGQPVDFEYILKHGDRVSVYPVFEKLNIRNVSMLRKFPLRRVRFIADVDLQDMVQLMRILGFDTTFNVNCSIPDIIEISGRENRIILTKQKELLKSESVTHAVRVCSGPATKQVCQLIDDLDIKDRVKPFSRCIRCNTRLTNLQTKAILDQISPETDRIFEKYLHCIPCRKDDRQNRTRQLKVDIIRLYV